MNRVFKLEIDLENDAFAGDVSSELADTLVRLAAYISRWGIGQSVVCDLNGNKVGAFKVEGYLASRD